jgi:hypothetical protein
MKVEKRWTDRQRPTELQFVHTRKNIRAGVHLRLGNSDWQTCWFDSSQQITSLVEVERRKRVCERLEDWFILIHVLEECLDSDAMLTAWEERHKYVYASCMYVIRYIPSSPHGSTALIRPEPPQYKSLTFTLRHTTLGGTPLDEWSARRRDHYLPTHNTHNRQITTPPQGTLFV